MNLIDFRLYRLAFAARPARGRRRHVLARGRPGRARAGRPRAATFDGDRAAALARQIATTAPDRDAGQRGRRRGRRPRRRAVRRGHRPAPSPSSASRPSSTATTSSLRNVVLTLPGDADATDRRRRRPRRRRAARRRRRAPPRPGSCSSSRTRSGSATEPPSCSPRPAARRPAPPASASCSRACPSRDSIEAVVVISQPGAAEPRAAVRGRQLDRERRAPRRSSSAPRQLAVETSRSSEPAGATSACTQLARLAIPSGPRRPGAADRRGLRRGRDLVRGRAAAGLPPTTSSTTSRAGVDRRLRPRGAVDGRRARRRDDRARSTARAPTSSSAAT